VDDSNPFYKNPENATNGSWWMVQILSTRAANVQTRIPPTAVGGWFRSFYQQVTTLLLRAERAGGEERAFVERS